jgi:endonuclease YncB( thermonuclease family)
LRDEPLRPQGRTERAELVRVVDGDTIRVSIDGTEYRVRYIGIDTPESVRPGSPVEEFAIEASEANRELVVGRRLVLERDVSETDRFGRLLRYVWTVDGADRHTFVNLELLRLGYAQVATYPPDVRYVDLFLAAQREAREAERGLWSRE